ncbi:GIY-YIG nuclease family protein [Lacticaseibacillus jixianensis]|uniref:GIY-YIG nuclease family protein n=1 Tax=Lacticaseibacillus jixianensis TaxID=2486012 RepID=A0ABW4BBU5_9LACO|nr:GIY-YIG nuclease family protein [Lacticaseibacillus jixianensis]
MADEETTQFGHAQPVSVTVHTKRRRFRRLKALLFLYVLFCPCYFDYKIIQWATVYRVSSGMGPIDVFWCWVIALGLTAIIVGMLYLPVTRRVRQYLDSRGAAPGIRPGAPRTKFSTRLKHRLTGQYPHIKLPRRSHNRNYYFALSNGSCYCAYAQPFSELVATMADADATANRARAVMRPCEDQLQEALAGTIKNESDLPWPNLVWRNDKRALSLQLPLAYQYFGLMQQMEDELKVVVEQGARESHLLDQVEPIPAAVGSVHGMYGEIAEVEDGNEGVNPVAGNHNDTDRKFALSEDHIGDYWRYVLLMANGQFYVGVTNNPQRRLKEHLSGEGSSVTHIGHPIGLASLEHLGKLTYRDSEHYEDAKTLALMARFGIDNVRGGHWAMPKNHDVLFFLTDRRRGIKSEFDVDVPDLLRGLRIPALDA